MVLWGGGSWGQGAQEVLLLLLLPKMLSVMLLLLLRTTTRQPRDSAACVAHHVARPTQGGEGGERMREEGRYQNARGWGKAPLPGVAELSKEGWR